LVRSRDKNEQGTASRTPTTGAAEPKDFNQEGRIRWKSISTFPEGLKATSHSPLTFEASRLPEKLLFLAFYRIRDEVYTTYVQQILHNVDGYPSGTHKIQKLARC
jgi:hypothetical protein